MTIDNRPTELLRYKTCSCLFCDHWVYFPGSEHSGNTSPTTMTVHYFDDRTIEITSITQERNHSA